MTADDAAARVAAFLDEMDRIAERHESDQYHDILYGLNGYEIRRSDLRVILAAIAPVQPMSVVFTTRIDEPPHVRVEREGQLVALGYLHPEPPRPDPLRAGLEALLESTIHVLRADLRALLAETEVPRG